MKEQIIQQGAEAVLIKSGGRVLKRRLKKSYRLTVIDNKLRKARTKSESKLLEKSFKIINTPRVLKTDKFEIDMEFVDGLKLFDNLDLLENWEDVCKDIGVNIAKLHDNDVIHGDLTTSNMILSDNRVYFIDFGLGYGNGKIEDKAVDLHLIKQALEAKHFAKWESYWEKVSEGYLGESKNAREVLKRLEKVEKRGRYKGAY